MIEGRGAQVLLFVLVCRGPAECRFAGWCVRCLWDRRSLERTGVWGAHAHYNIPTRTGAPVLSTLHGSTSRTDPFSVHESAWILMGMPLPAVRGAKHSCATTAEVKILHWGPSHVEMPTPSVK